jgi:putative transposase
MDIDMSKIFVDWNNASTHQDDEIEAVVRAAAGRLVLLYLPTYSPWLNRIEMLWRHFRRELTQCKIFETLKILIEAPYSFFNGREKLFRKESIFVLVRNRCP